ncbi:MAG: anti-sigma factor family protein [Candidatus Binatia bacterium]
MNCEAYQDITAAHVNGVLSPPECQEAVHHLDTCASCRHLFAEQSRFHIAFSARRFIVSVPTEVERRLRAALAAEHTPTAAFWERLSPFVFLPRLALGLAAAGLLIALLLPHLFSAVSKPAEFALAVDYYQAVTEGQIAFDYRTNNPQEMKAALNRSGQLDFTTHVLDLRPAGYQLKGGQVVGGKDHPIALTLYEGEEGPIVCLRQRGMAPPRPANGKGMKGKYLYTHAGYTISFFQHQEHFCILISRLSQEALRRRLAM